MSSKFDEFAERAKKIAAESGESVKEKLSKVEDWDEIREMAGGLGEEAASFVRKYPLQSVLGAAAAGFLLGASLGKKR